MRTVNKDDNYITVIPIVEHSCTDLVSERGKWSKLGPKNYTWTGNCGLQFFLVLGRACLAGRAFQESFPLQEMRKTQRETNLKHR